MTTLNWSRFIGTSILLPIIISYLCYRFYQVRNRRRVMRNFFRGRVVLVTGASSGLGEALSYELYQLGAKVILASRNLECLQKVRDSIVESRSPDELRESFEPKVLRLDLADLDSIPEIAKKTTSLFGSSVDILINNGGISYRGEISQTKLEVDVKVMTVNYFGQVALTKALLPLMLERKEGCVVGISSVQGKMGIPMRSAYAASKHATQAFYDILRSEVVDAGIQVCLFSPGYIKTSLSLNAITGSGQQYNVMDANTEQGLPPSEVAFRILAKVAEGRSATDEVISSLSPRLGLALRTWAPSLYFYVMRKRAQKLRLEQGGSSSD